MIDQKDISSIDEIRKFGVLLSVVFALVAWSLLWKDYWAGFPFTIVAFSLFTVALFRPDLLRRPSGLGIRVMVGLERTVINVFLTLFYWCVFVPAGYLLKGLRLDFFSRNMVNKDTSHWEKSPDSYWKPRKKIHSAGEKWEKQY